MASSSSPPASHPYSYGAFSAGAPSSATSLHPPVLVPPPHSAFSQGREGPKEVITRRIATFVHIKAVITGRQLHAGVVQLHRRDLALIWDIDKTRKRSYRHLALGLALSPLLDIQTLTELVRALLAALSDVEALPEAAGGTSGGLTGGAMATLGLGAIASGSGAEKKGVRNLFSSKLKPSKKGALSDTFAPSDLGLSSGMGISNSVVLGGATDTLVGVLPFALDFVQTLVTLLDTLVEVYARLLLFVAPTPQTPQINSTAGLGYHRSQPSSSSLNSSSASAAAAAVGGTASSRPTYYVPMSTQSSAQSHHSHLAPPLSRAPSEDGKHAHGHHDPASPPSVNLSPTMLELMNKVDIKIKKLLIPITKDLDSLARHIIKEELSLLESGASTSRPPQSSPPGTMRFTSSSSSYNNNKHPSEGLVVGPLSLWNAAPPPPHQPPSTIHGHGHGHGHTEEDGATLSYTPTGMGGAALPHHHHHHHHQLSSTAPQTSMGRHNQQGSHTGTAASSGEWQRLR